MVDVQDIQPAVVAGLRPVVNPDLPPRVRRRLADLNTSARIEDHLPWNKPATDERQTARSAAVCAAPLMLELALFLPIAFSGQDFSWKHARLGELLWLVGGQTVAVFVGAGVCWLIGAVRTVRRRAPVLRRRHAGRYVSVAELAELRLNAQGW
jgi:hypothetical protein